jgi:hypothetical protein
VRTFELFGGVQSSSGLEFAALRISPVEGWISGVGFEAFLTVVARSRPIPTKRMAIRPAGSCAEKRVSFGHAPRSVEMRWLDGISDYD